MERRLNFEGMISHHILKTKLSNWKNTMPTLHKNRKKKKKKEKRNLLALSGNKMESYYDRSHSFNKNIIIFMVFFAYEYLNVETVQST